MSRKVDFITFCHPPHLEKLHAPGVLEEMLESHRYPFNAIHVIHQRCRGIPYRPLEGVHIHESEDYPNVLGNFGINPDNPQAERMTHGPGASHYWKWHCINHLIGLVVTKADHVVFSDCDCLMKRNDSPTWVLEGLDYLSKHGRCLVVSPNDGSDERNTQNMSQQLFLCNVHRFRSLNFDLPFLGFDAPGGPMQEYYWMLEGRIGRIMQRFNYHRRVLDEKHRYWHYNPWEPTGWLESTKNR